MSSEVYLRKKFKETYGIENPSPDALTQFSKFLSAHRMPKSMTYEHSNYSFIRSNAAASDFAKKAESDRRIEEGKEFLKDKDLTCFKIRLKQTYSGARKEIVLELKERGLRFREMEKLLTDLIGTRIGKHGLAYIYHGNLRKHKNNK